MEVTDVKVRFMRKIQIREYEPAEAEVSFSAQLAADEDHASAALALMEDAKSAVRDGLAVKVGGRKAADKPAAESKPAAETKPAAEEAPAEDKPKRTRRTKAQMEEAKKAEADAAAGGSDVPGDDDVPGEDDAKGNISTNPEDRTDPNDVPGADDVPGGDDVPGEDDVTLDDLIGGDDPTHEDLNELISNAVGGTGKKKVAGGTIKEILVSYKAARVRDVPKDKIQDVMNAIQAKIDG